MKPPVVVIGDSLLDRDLTGHARRLCPEGPVPVLERPQERARPGGAGLAAALIARQDRPVTLITAIGDDAPGARLQGLLADAGVAVINLGTAGPTEEKVRVGTEHHLLVRLDSGTDPAPPGPITSPGRAALWEAAAVLVADYGRGMAGEASIRAALEELVAAARSRRPLVWDPHPRGFPPVHGTSLVTPNSAEAGLEPDAPLSDVAAAGARLLADWRVGAVAITLGARGAALVTAAEEPPLLVTPQRRTPGDACGAGDRFASAAACGLADGGVLSEAVIDAVAAATDFVAAGGAGAVSFPEIGRDAVFGDSIPVTGRGATVARGTAGDADVPGRDAASVVASVRAEGGTVVATGGCFDILHAGHVSLLQAARAQGDCLVVCLNSDASVRRLKGPGRPIQPAEDRRQVLLALGCVDAVEVFDDDTPIPVLRRLRPDVFAKGADYSLATLPEAAVLAEWGGQAVVLPCLEGRSTTHVLKEAIRRAHS